ncbi:MAG: helix-turn-helix domain-containing protein [Opitutaceae bacterium]|nr:helix-turn-helix domain-containing protein [Opitutaceae bacterium]
MPARKKKTPKAARPRTTRTAPEGSVARMLGASVRGYRKARKLTQEVVAERADLSTNYVGNIERGEYDVTVAVLQRVARAMDARASVLLDRAGL